MKEFNIVVTDRIYLKAKNEKEAINQVEKYYDNLGLYSVDIKIVKGGWIRMTKYTFNVSFQKTIIASNKVEAYDILQGKLQHISENKTITLVEEKE